MRKELPYFLVEEAFGGWQEWFPDYRMRVGGCAAVTACDVSIFCDLYRGTHLYPFDVHHITKKDYIRFGMEMKPYLRPRWSGIDHLDIYTSGFEKFLKDKGETSLTMDGWDGNFPYEATKNQVRAQLDAGYPIPCLTLKHRAPSMMDYTWHWYILGGYAEFDQTLMVKVITYGSWRWMDLSEIWHTGFRRKGGLILFHQEPDRFSKEKLLCKE